MTKRKNSGPILVLACWMASCSSQSPVTPLVDAGGDAPPPDAGPTPSGWEPLVLPQTWFIELLAHPSGNLLAGTDDMIGLQRLGPTGIWEEPLPDFSAWTIAMSPHDPNVVFAGDPYGRGIARSLDGGTTWTRVIDGFPIGLTTVGVMSIDVSPHEPSRVYAGVTSQSGAEPGLGRGLWRSDNTGSSWSLIALEGKEVSAVHASRANPNTLLVGLGGRTGSQGVGGITRSLDGGKTWEPVQFDGLPIVNFATDSSDPNRIYVATFGAGVLRSTDGGTTWKAGSGQGANTLSWVVRQDPTQANRLYSVIPYLGTTSLLVSQDRGETWGPSGLSNVTAISVGVQQDGTLLVGTYGDQLLRSRDGGQTWQADLDSPSHSYVYAPLLIHPDDPLKLLAPAHYLGAAGGVFFSNDGGSTWQASQVPEVVGGLGNVLGLARDPQNANRVLAAALSEPADSAGLWESSDGGASFSQKSLAGTMATSVAISPSQPQSVWVGTTAGLHLSADGGASFPVTKLDGLWIASITFDPNAPNHAVVATGGQGWGHNIDTGFWATSDGGQSFTVLPFSSSLGAYNAVFSPDGSVYYAHEGGVSRSADGGQTAEQLLSRPSDKGTWLARDPTSGTLYYTGYNYAALIPGGVLQSKDNGTTWEAIETNGPGNEVWALAIDPGRRLYASTYGSGVWARRLE